jgi:flagellar motor switch protein FliM
MKGVKTEAVSLVHARQPRATFAALHEIGEDIGSAVQTLVTGIIGQVPRVEMHAGKNEISVFGIWKKSRSTAPVFCRLKMDPLGGEILIALSLRFVTRLVECHYGGTGANIAERSSLKVAELNFLQHLGPCFATMIADAWSKHLEVSAEFLGLDIQNSEPTAVNDADEVIIQSFTLSGPPFEDARIEIIYPDVLVQAAGALAAAPNGGVFRADPAWQARLKAAVMQAHVPLRTIFVRTELPLNRLLNLSVGDLIPICLPSRIPVTVGGVNFADATLGATNGRASIRIETLSEGRMARG